MNNFLLKLNKKIKKNKKGFTLVELIIVIAIMATITTLSIFNSSNLNSNVLLSNTAYEIGLIIRDAQVAGLGARVLSTNVEGVNVATTSNQGIYFDITKPEEVVFFTDLDKSNKFESNEPNQVYAIKNKRAGKILSIYKLDDTSPEGKTLITDLNILFKRPNPEAYFYYTENNDLTHFIGNVGVNIGFVNGECRSVIIYKTGAIQIDKSFCD